MFFKANISYWLKSRISIALAQKNVKINPCTFFFENLVSKHLIGVELNKIVGSVNVKPIILHEFYSIKVLMIQNLRQGNNLAKIKLKNE